jgi:hypothetical protein
VTVHDLRLAIEARDAAVQQVDDHADETWKLDARKALWTLIQRKGVGDVFTTDDIDCYQPREPRAWGPIMLRAARAGYIENTGLSRKSRSVTCHARPKALWRVVRL